MLTTPASLARESPLRERSGRLEANAPAAEFRVLDAESLLGGRREIGIRLGEALYRLRLTRNGRLILTK